MTVFSPLWTCCLSVLAVSVSSSSSSSASAGGAVLTPSVVNRDAADESTIMENNVINASYEDVMTNFNDDTTPKPMPTQDFNLSISSIAGNNKMAQSEERRELLTTIAYSENNGRRSSVNEEPESHPNLNTSGLSSSPESDGVKVSSDQKIRDIMNSLPMTKMQNNSESHKIMELNNNNSSNNKNADDDDDVDKDGTEFDYKLGKICDKTKEDGKRTRKRKVLVPDFENNRENTREGTEPFGNDISGRSRNISSTESKEYVPVKQFWESEYNESNKVDPSDVTKVFTQTDITKGFTQTDVTRGFTETDVTKGLTQTDVTKGFIQTDVTKGFTQTDVTEGLTQTDITMGFIQTDVTEGLTQTDVTRGFTETDVTKGLTQTDVTKGLIQTDVTEGLTQTDVTKGLIRTDVTEGLTQTDVTKGLIRTDVTEGLTQTDVTRGFTQMDVTKGLTQTDVTESFTQTDVTKGDISTDVIADMTPSSWLAVGVKANVEVNDEPFTLGCQQEYFSVNNCGNRPGANKSGSTNDLGHDKSSMSSAGGNESWNTAAVSFAHDLHTAVEEVNDGNGHSSETSRISNETTPKLNETDLSENNSNSKGAKFVYSETTVSSNEAISISKDLNSMSNATISNPNSCETNCSSYKTSFNCSDTNSSSYQSDCSKTHSSSYENNNSNCSETISLSNEINSNCSETDSSSTVTDLSSNQNNSESTENKLDSNGKGYGTERAGAGKREGTLTTNTVLNMRVAVSTITILVCIVGIVLNIPSMLVFRKLPSSSSNSYLGCLVVLDTICLLVALPITTVQMFYGRQASLPATFVYFRLYVGLTLLIGMRHVLYVITCLMTVDRFLALVCTMKVVCKNPLSHARFITAIVVVLVNAFTTSDIATRLQVKAVTAPVTGLTTYLILPRESVNRNQDVYAMLSLASNAVLRFIPIFIILTLNVGLYVALVKHSRKMQEAGISNHIVHRREIKMMKSVRAVLLFSFVFLLLGLPYTSMQIIDLASPGWFISEPLLFEIISVVLPLLDVISSASDFFIFYAVNINFRKGFKSLICRA